MYIAVDAMGGDHAPGAVVEGALQAVEEHEIPVLLVGDEESIRRELERLGKQESSSLAIRHAAERVDMGESPIAAIRGKPDSSMRVALQLVKSGEARAVVSAGNSGAMLALAVTVLGTLKGVDRPAIVTVIPALGGIRVYWMPVPIPSVNPCTLSSLPLWARSTHTGSEGLLRLVLGC